MPGFSGHSEFFISFLSRATFSAIKIFCFQTQMYFLSDKLSPWWEASQFAAFGTQSFIV